MIIHLQDCPEQPWKNGLGSTREIAVQPSDTNSEAFLWRVSIAAVDTAAPFSQFQGIDRHIALLSGNGFSMKLDDSQTHELVKPFEPFAFAGEAIVAVKLVDGPTRDFNLMVRRARASGEVQVWRGPETRSSNAATVLLFCAYGEVDTVEGRLYAGDAWRPSLLTAAAVTLRGSAVALAVHIEAHAL
ncbi:MAG: HutD family protein [Rhodanobacter sp.]